MANKAKNVLPAKYTKTREKELLNVRLYFRAISRISRAKLI